MAPTPVLIFPHTHVEDRLLERLMEMFGSLTLCQPWFTEPTVPPKAAKDGNLKVCFPPEALKPKTDFRHLLREYQGWMMDHQGKNRTTTVLPGETGDETWTIRKAIRDAGKGAEDPASSNTLKWHLILHLARNLEEDRQSAQDLLQQAARRKSPLVEAVAQEEEVPDMFKDLPLSGAAYPYVTDRHLGLIFEAWFGLFEQIVEAGSEFLTLDRQVIAHASTLFDGCDVQPLEDTSLSQTEEFDITGLRLERKRLPRLLNPSISKDPVLKNLSGKSLILAEYQN